MRMNHIERMFAAIRRQEPDKIPKGEIGQGIDETGRLERKIFGNSNFDELLGYLQKICIPGDKCRRLDTKGKAKQDGIERI